jgi:YjjW family glycine radical enzyme activase
MCENSDQTAAVVNKIIPFSSVDGPGNRTAIFFQGCNFDCLYCHNPETINLCSDCGKCVPVCPTSALEMVVGRVFWQEDLCINCDKCLEICERDSSPQVREMTVNQVLKKIEKNKPFISGVTVSGGEALLQSDFIKDLFREVKKLGLTTFLDTNGSISLAEKDELLEYFDQAMIDAKSFKNAEHQSLTGRKNDQVLENIKFMAGRDKLYEVRTVIVPELLNNYYNVDQISSLLGEIAPDVRYKLIKYRSAGVRTDKIETETPGDDYMQQLADRASENGCQNVVVV